MTANGVVAVAKAKVYGEAVHPALTGALEAPMRIVRISRDEEACEFLNQLRLAEIAATSSKDEAPQWWKATSHWVTESGHVFMCVRAVGQRESGLLAPSGAGFLRP